MKARSWDEERRAEVLESPTTPLTAAVIVAQAKVDKRLAEIQAFLRRPKELRNATDLRRLREPLAGAVYALESALQRAGLPIPDRPAEMSDCSMKPPREKPFVEPCRVIEIKSRKVVDPLVLPAVPAEALDGAPGITRAKEWLLRGPAPFQEIAVAAKAAGVTYDAMRRALGGLALRGQFYRMDDGRWSKR